MEELTDRWIDWFSIRWMDDSMDGWIDSRMRSLMYEMFDGRLEGWGGCMDEMTDGGELTEGGELTDGGDFDW